MTAAERLDEADFPLIYDMVRSKLAAGQVIKLPTASSIISFQVATLEPETADTRFDIELTWHKVIHDKIKYQVNSASYTGAELETWKLTKKDDTWVLTT
jgi:hypothetical protein